MKLIGAEGKPIGGRSQFWLIGEIGYFYFVIAGFVAGIQDRQSWQFINAAGLEALVDVDLAQTDSDADFG